MEHFEDFEEWFASLNQNKVDYLVIGGYAVAHHGHPRYTADIDIYYRIGPDNAERIVQALKDFGFGSLDISPADLQRPGTVIQLGNPPEQIDLLNRITGLEWEQATADRSPGFYGKIPVDYLGLTALLQNKRATGRGKDLGDVEELTSE